MVQHINKMLDIKEELFLKTRESHGVRIRSGRHNPRCDQKDFDILYNHLTETMAHKKIMGRKFGKYSYPENILEDEKLFNTAEFYRWIITKNKEAAKVLNARKCD